MQGFATYQEATEAVAAYDRTETNRQTKYYVVPNEQGGFKVMIARPGLRKLWLGKGGL
jgi:hypothetical protein